MLSRHRALKICLYLKLFTLLRETKSENKINLKLHAMKHINQAAIYKLKPAQVCYLN